MSTTKWSVIGALLVLIIAGLAALVLIPSRKVLDSTLIPASIDNTITVTSPLPHATVTSPLSIQGTARGTWYFEASAPVELRDANGKVIAQGHVTAQGDWMTEEYVPFTATLTFSAPATKTGTLVLKNDNPSGDPAREKELDISVVF